MTRTVELTIPCAQGYERIAMNPAADFARLIAFPPDRIDDLRTAVAEACINAMEHGNAMEGSTTVELVMREPPTASRWTSSTGAAAHHRPRRCPHPTSRGGPMAPGRPEARR